MYVHTHNIFLNLFHIVKRLFLITPQPRIASQPHQALNKQKQSKLSFEISFLQMYISHVCTDNKFSEIQTENTYHFEEEIIAQASKWNCMPRRFWRTPRRLSVSGP
jgi:hypothetical protein